MAKRRLFWRLFPTYIAITVLEAIETGEAKSRAASLASQTELASLSLQRPSDDGGVTTQD